MQAAADPGADATRPPSFESGAGHLDTVARLAALLCATRSAQVDVLEGRFIRAVAGWGPLLRPGPAFWEVLSAGGRLLLSDATRDARFAGIGAQGLAAVPLLGPDGNTVGSLTVGDRCPRDFDEQQLAALAGLATLAVASLELETSTERLAAVIDNSSDAIAVLDERGTITFVSPAVQRLLGREPADLVGVSAFDVLDPADVPLALASFAGTLAHPGRAEPLELRFRHADGSIRAAEVVANNLLDDPAVAGVVMNVRDLADRYRSQHELRRQATHDQLTGLPNRQLLRDYLGATLTAAGMPVAVLFLDLDRFKVINDSLGHQTGDQLLVEMGKRLRAAVRPTDLVARLGGDEFVAVCHGVVDAREASAIARRVAAKVSAPLSLNGREIVITASIGVVLRRPGEPDADGVLQNADAAMYAAKERGRACFVLFDEALAGQASARLEVEQDLRRALERGELELWYQPVVLLAPPPGVEAVVGAEALMRWRHPERGLVPPSDFISLAEDLGIIGSIGSWALEEACRQATAWTAALKRPFGVAVNLSALQLADPGLTVLVAQAVVDAGLDPALLALELTESMLAAEGRDVVGALERLSQLGVKLSIDDFGTGYSSLAYLKRFPVTALKVDRSFVAGLGVDAEDEAIVSAVISLAHTLGMGVVAEGIETEQQLEMLRAMGCELGQGYLLGRPAPAPDLDGQIARSRPTQ